MKAKLKKRLSYFLLSIPIAFLFPALSHGDIEENIVETSTGFYYVVQKGDTLWDLSEQFADSPWYWPEMWQHNPDIANPHLIYPGQRIQIYRKDWVEREEIPVDIELPEPDRYFRYAGINAIGFIRETEARHFGSVIKVKEDHRLISSGDKVFIEPAEGIGEMVEGGLYAIYRTTGPVNDPVTDEYVGMQHIITGIAEITQVEDRFAVGMIDSSFRDTREGDLVMPFRERSDQVRLQDSVADLRGRLIKAEDGQAIIGEHMLAFINKGKNDMVEPGQSYTLYYQETASAGVGQDPLILTEEDLGEVLVLHVEDTTSTVLVTNSLDRIAAGTAFKAKE